MLCKGAEVESVAGRMGKAWKAKWNCRVKTDLEVSKAGLQSGSVSPMHCQTRFPGQGRDCSSCVLQNVTFI